MYQLQSQTLGLDLRPENDPEYLVLWGVDLDMVRTPDPELDNMVQNQQIEATGQLQDNYSTFQFIPSYH